MEIIGISDLPLHYGKVPNWLIPIMRRLSRAILDVMILEWGPDKILEKLSNPLWFQGFNNVIGMDWDSSGSTTVTLGILKEVVNPKDDGLAITGGKGKSSLNVPKELESLPSRFNLNVTRLARISKLIAKVDTTLLQDGHELYHHSLLVSESGRWIVIQQGMNPQTRFARRYHWKSVNDPVNQEREALAGVKSKAVLNVHVSVNAKRTIMDLLRENPQKLERDYLRSMAILKGQSLESWMGTGTIGAISSEAKLVYMRPVDVKRIVKVIYEVQQGSPSDLEDALLLGVGPSTMRALSLISDLIYRDPPSYEDPVNAPYDPFKYAYAIGGKDGIPFPVNREIAFEVIQTLEDFVTIAKLEKKDKALALNKLRDLRLGVKEGA